MTTKSTWRCPARATRADRKVETTASPYAQIELRDRVTLLRQALEKLAPTLRTAVMMRDIQEMSYQEIADRLSLPEGTVKSRINRGRTELARQIQILRAQQDAVRGVTG